MRNIKRTVTTRTWQVRWGKRGSQSHVVMSIGRWHCIPLSERKEEQGWGRTGAEGGMWLRVALNVEVRLWSEFASRQVLHWEGFVQWFQCSQNWLACPEGPKFPASMWTFISFSFRVIVHEKPRSNCFINKISAPGMKLRSPFSVHLKLFHYNCTLEAQLSARSDPHLAPTCVLISCYVVDHWSTGIKPGYLLAITHENSKMW